MSERRSRSGDVPLRREVQGESKPGWFEDEFGCGLYLCLALLASLTFWAGVLGLYIHLRQR